MLMNWLKKKRGIPTRHRLIDCIERKYARSEGFVYVISDNKIISSVEHFLTKLSRALKADLIIIKTDEVSKTIGLKYGDITSIKNNTLENVYIFLE